jgi:Rrf2 family transcriptional regulator, cysteine metabolism repressor
MKISNKSIYGLKFMICLASVYDDKLMSISEVAGKEKISEKFLENIVATIKASGLVKVKRGAHGGYHLAKSPSHITMKDLFEALEPDILKNERINNESAEPSDIAIQKIMNELESNIQNFLEMKTLEELVRHYEALKPGQMFYI